MSLTTDCVIKLIKLQDSIYLQCVCIPYRSEVVHGFSCGLFVHVQLLTQRLQTPPDWTLLHPPRLGIRRLFAPHTYKLTLTVSVKFLLKKSPKSSVPSTKTRHHVRPHRNNTNQQLPHGRRTSAHNPHNAARWRQNCRAAANQRLGESLPRKLCAQPPSPALVLRPANCN